MGFFISVTNFLIFQISLHVTAFTDFVTGCYRSVTETVVTKNSV